MTNKWYGTANRDNPEAETQRLPLGDEWDSEPVAETAEDWYREHFHDTSSLQAKRTSSSGGLSINENADPDVRVDMETIFNRLVPENRPEYEHTLEGADDMPAHAKSTLSGVSITIPITDGRLNLGTWQGIYFCEYRNYGGSRELVVTIIGE